MPFVLRAVTPSDAAEFASWRYPAPYDVYDAEPGDAQRYLDPRWGYLAAVDEQGTLVGHVCFGEDGRVAGGIYTEEALDVGAGLRPDLTGRGLGSELLRAAIDQAGRRFPGRPLRVTIAAFNDRALRLVRKAGFEQAERFVTDEGREFVILVRANPGFVLVVVTGPPGSGKTTVARHLAETLSIPLYSKDDLKVVLYEALGYGGRERDRELGAAAMSLLEWVTRESVRKRSSLILESNFREQSQAWLRPAIAEPGCAAVQIRCFADRDVLVQRVRARAGTADRHPGHSDEEWLRTELEAALSSGQVMDLGCPLIELDTSGPADLATATERVCEALGMG